MHLGAFGNKLRTWASPFDIPRDVYLVPGKLFSVRSCKAGGRFLHRLLYAELLHYWNEMWVEEWHNYYVIDPAPDELRLLQGELVRGDAFRCDWQLYYRRVECGDITSLREEMRWPSRLSVAYGSQALGILQSVMSPMSWQELCDNVAQYPDAIYEISVFGQDVGDRVGCNALIWEVREY
jgi:hypothetical protein